jgi:HSP20 family protein
MSGERQHVPVRIYQTQELLMMVVPMPGLEPDNIAITVAGDRVTVHGEERGPHQHDTDVLVAEGTIGPYDREVRLPQPVNGQLTNATYGNGLLVLSMPKLAPGESVGAEEFRLEVVEATRGERVGHVGRDVRPARSGERRRGMRRAG